MLAGHYATALIANQKFPKGTLLFFLVVSQFQDFLWLIFHYLGLEETGPTDVFDATLQNLAVEMVYSHDLVPQLIWAVVVYLIGYGLFKSKAIALVGLVLFAGHFVLDVASGFPHNIFGPDTHSVGLGLYATSPYVAVLIELGFIVAALAYFFRAEAKSGVQRSRGSRAAILGVFAYGVVFMALVATVSFREMFSLPVFDVGFNTTVPMLAFTYVAMTWVLWKAVGASR